MRPSALTIPAATLVLLCTVACRRDVPEEPSPGTHTTPYSLDLPANFPAPIIPASNPLTQEGIALGRRLYYDTLLSQNGPFQGFACASCHHQPVSFTTPTSGTNVLAHVNLAWSTNFLWNGKVCGTLEDVMRFEVEEFFQVDIAGLNTHPDYPLLFQQAFGADHITTDHVVKALAQWFRRMVSSNSRLDRHLRGEIILTPEEMNGAMTFLSEVGDCFHCHPLPLMTDNGFHNIGLAGSFTGFDVGRYAITGAPMDMGAFKTPTLRNIALTAPYMHDGRFQTLEEVVEFYNSGVQHSASLDPLMTKPGPSLTLGLTPQEKANLVSFLNTLTDETFLTDPALGSPF
ncbi:MAG: cytochrome-c peroxidase [Flavobacteriales bacterium]|nr:Cytochrome c551 peroxidase [Flavobacteriales bacterium]MCC6578290.1 cytochrome-c peroxidase [Flavobacteriales bacterium]NUQ15158.1 cytochrome-c peroxidase [Flavobacteriales bacterium]